MENNIITLEKLKLLDAPDYIVTDFRSLGVESITADEYCVNTKNTCRSWFIEWFDLNPESLKILSQDKNWVIRWGLLHFHDLPTDILIGMLKEKNKCVKQLLVQQKNITEEALTILSNDRHEFVRAAVARNPKTLKKDLQRLSKCKSFMVTYEVFRNPNTPEHVVNSFSPQRRYKFEEQAKNSLW